jgi:serine/threonine-protein kinase
MRLSSVKNVIKTYEKKILNNSTIIIAMEYIDGVSLRKYIDIKKTLPLNEALYIIKKVIVAIKEMHKFTDKIIHRDLKPENILLSNDLLQVKLIDFGISSVTKKLKNNRIKLQTNEHAIFGTYPYLSPDIIKLSSAEYEEEKKKYISEQLDFFSIGVILYEMLSGKKPFFASDYNKKEVIELPLKFDFIPLSSYNGEIPASVDNIIFRCLASKPYELHYRYTNADEILKDINMIGKSSNVQLIKPLNKCVIPIKNFFNIEKEKNLERNYEKY